MRRALIQTLILLLGLFATLAVQATEVRAARLWPSPEYSRITFELSDVASYKYFRLKNPERLVLDLEGVEPEGALLEMATRVSPQDPQIASIRVARNRPGVTRVVVELKTEIRPQVFTLKPMGDYGHRLVLDVYPTSLEAMEKQVEAAIDKAGRAGKAGEKGAAAQPGKLAAKPEYVRLITVAIDAGHGGEDPGAKGANGAALLEEARGLIRQYDR